MPGRYFKDDKPIIRYYIARVTEKKSLSKLKIKKVFPVNI
jgi:hypothetical protein